ncbi:MAG: LLM class flavin-dependent oxidoreductase [Pseudomonadales bacterium]|nr:LLM class flavin-dependent oxidoreductase [Pseudomonadales bacterium]
MSLRIGLFYPNAPSIHVMSRTIAAMNPDFLSLEVHKEIGQTCEQLGLDYLFLADGWAGYEEQRDKPSRGMLMAPVLASALMAVTERIGLITTIHTSWFHPLQITRIGAAMAMLSRGRWGINVVSGSGFTDHLLGQAMAETSHDARYDRAAECMEIVMQAWRTGRIDNHGEFFDIEGYAPGPVIPEEFWPLIVSAGASDAGRAFAGKFADFIFMPGRTPQNLLDERVNDIRKIATTHNRQGADVKLQMHASIIVRETQAEADLAIQRVRDSVDMDAALGYLKSVRKNVSTYDDIYREMGELQVREIGMVSGARSIHGDVAEAVAQFEALHDMGCDGVAMTFPIWSPKEIRRFGELVLPELEKRGIWQPAWQREGGW